MFNLNAKFVLQMENLNIDCNDPENSKDNVNFQMYFSMVKSNEMPWNLFIQSMKYMIPLLDLTKSKKLIFDLLEEIKGFIEREAEYKDKQNRVSELEQSNEILRKENESLQKGCDELKRKLPSFFAPKENQKDISSNSRDLTFTHWSNLRSQVENSPHQPDLHFLMRKDLYFHVGYATKIKSGASHYIMGAPERGTHN